MTPVCQIMILSCLSLINSSTQKEDSDTADKSGVWDAHSHALYNRMTCACCIIVRSVCGNTKHRLRLRHRRAFRLHGFQDVVGRGNKNLPPTWSKTPTDFTLSELRRKLPNSAIPEIIASPQLSTVLEMLSCKHQGTCCSTELQTGNSKSTSLEINLGQGFGGTSSSLTSNLQR